MDALKKIFYIYLVFNLSGCQTGYLLHLLGGQTEIWWKRTSTASVLEDTKTPAPVIEKIRLIQDVKLFAERTLLLTPGKNYSKYVDLDRPAISWLVIAAEKWRLEPKKWGFPFVGEFPYKGFFSLERAKDFAQELKTQGYDVHIGTVGAFSYLGWMTDPIFSTFIGMEEADLVELILHESVHATVFIKNNVDFNEQLATFYARKGKLLYFATYSDLWTDEKIKSILDEQESQDRLNSFLRSEVLSLKQWYVQNSSQQDMLLREEQFRKIQKKYEQELKPTLRKSVGEWILKRELNNAILAGFATYQQNLAEFEKIYQRCEQSLPCFLSKIRTLESHPNPWQGLEAMNHP